MMSIATHEKHCESSEITRDLRRRMESSRKWLEEDINDTSSSVEESPSLSPTRRARWGGAQHTSSAVADVQPKLSPSLHPQRKSIKSSEVKKHKLESPSKTYHFGEGDAHIPSKPAEGLPEGWVTRKIPRKNPRDSRVDTRVSNFVFVLVKERCHSLFDVVC